MTLKRYAMIKNLVFQSNSHKILIFHIMEQNVWFIRKYMSRKIPYLKFCHNSEHVSENLTEIK